MTSAEPAVSVALNGTLGAFRLDVAFDVPMRGVTALFGPSGCGKTTILRCIAGLERLPGRLAIGKEVWQDDAAGTFLPAHRRHVGYVFQEASLFAHLSVCDNLLFGAKRAGGSIAPQGLALDDIVGLLGITHLLDRSPTTLSGGERQRVAVDRALLSGPRILLMDEPLSALDRMTKEEILPYFEMLHETLALPILYVSHDLSEVERLADTLVLLESGRVLASGALSELQTDPSLPLLGSPDAAVVLEGRIAGFDAEYGLTQITIPGGELMVAGRHGARGDPRRIRIAASDISIARSAASDSTILNCLEARIVSLDLRDDAPQVNVILSLGEDGAGSRIVASITRKSSANLGLKAGDRIFAQIKGVAIVAARTGQSFVSRKSRRDP